MLEMPQQFNSPFKENKIAPVKSNDRFNKFTAGNELMVDAIIAKKGKRKWWKPDFIEKYRREDIIKKIQQMTEKKRSILKDYERKKSPDEIQLINLANKITNIIIENYSDKDLDVSADDIHIIDFDKVLSFRKKTDYFNDNYINKLEQCIIIGDIYENEKTKLLLHHFVILCHEIFHAKSYTSVGLSSEDKSLTLKQVGIRLEIRDKQYFQGLNEAITEKLTEMVMDYLYEHADDVEIAMLFGSLIQESKNKREDKEFLNKKIPFLFKGDAIIFDKDHRNDPISQELRKPHYVLSGPEHAGSIRYISYIYERFIMEKLVEKICEKTGKEKDEVNKIFISAYFNGKIDEFKKIIDESFSVGTFREIGLAYSVLGSDRNYLMKARRLENIINRL